MLMREVLHDVAAGRRALSRDERDWCIGEAMVLSGSSASPTQLLADGEAALAPLNLDTPARRNEGSFTARAPKRGTRRRHSLSRHEVSAMARCDVCGNEYDKAFTVTAARQRHVRFLRMRDPRAGADLRALRVPDHRPRRRARRRLLLLRALRQANRRERDRRPHLSGEAAA